MIRKKSLLNIFLFLSVLNPLFPISWPVEDPVISATFGQDKLGSFNNGIEISGKNVEVKPSESGEVIYYSEESNNSIIPSVMGDFIIIEHERKLRTLYASIDFEKQPELYKKVSMSDVLGRTANIETESDSCLFFALMDSEFQQFLNPLLLLNTIVDDKFPIIEEVGIQTSKGYKKIMEDTNISSGDAQILLKMYDPSMTKEETFRMMPFKIHLFNNGEEIFFVAFESIRYEDGKAVVQTQNELFYSDYFRDDGFVSLGKMNLVPGKSRFEVLISDYSGNEKSFSFNLTITD